MKKHLDVILNILLIFLITFFVMKLFFPNDHAQTRTGLNMGFSNTSYTIPASPKVHIDNYTGTEINLNTCQDISIFFNGEALKFNSHFCKDITVNPNTKYILSYAEEYDKFDTFGPYTLKSNVGGKEYFSQIQIRNKGSISKIFSTLIYAPIYNLVVWLMELFSYSFGWAIVAVTIIIRLILMYPQQKMMISQKKLQALQPKIKKIQEEYKKDKQQLGLKMLELYKKEKINPFGSAGLLLIQMPILLVVYNIIHGIQDPANVYYIYNFLQPFDLLKVNFDFLGLDLLKVGGQQGLILAFIIGFVQFVQIKLSFMTKKKDIKKDGLVLEKKKGDDKYSELMPNPEIMNKVMLIGMPIMVAVFTYTLFAGIGIYWGITTLFMIIQQLIVNNIIKK